MYKYEMKNKGVPLFCDHKADLPAKQGTAFDSYYVICNFEHDGKQYGFEWHHQSMGGQVVTSEFLMMDANREIWSNNAITEPISQTTGQRCDKLFVYSTYGTFEGDHKEMRLKISVDDGAVDVTLKPRENNILYNGATGLLKFSGSESYQYSYFNMDIAGTMTIKGSTVPITNTTALFDRQWSFVEGISVERGSGLNKCAWLWLGMTLNDDSSGAVSLWDSYSSEGRYCFATIYNQNGTMVNAPAEITYEDIWTSKHSGHRYPTAVKISVPLENLELHLTMLPDDPEFYRGDNSICGCQSLCKVEGNYKAKAIDRYVILEIIGDLCGKCEE